MKFIHIAAAGTATLVLLSTSACSNFSNRGTVENPIIGSASTHSLSFEKIELSDSSTMLHAVIHFIPKYWVRIASTSKITADGQEYSVTGIDGAQFDERIWMPDSGVIRFTLTFPPVPSKVKSIDFSEGTDDGWRLWDIDLTGCADHNANVSLIPSAVRKLKTDGALPEPIFAFDTTTVNIHLVGYRPEMSRKIRYAVNTMHGQVAPDVPVTLDSLGNAQVKIALSAPANIFLFNAGDLNISGSTLLAPGETIDLYSDVHTSGLSNMSNRNPDIYFAFPEGYQASYASGRYGHMSALQPKYYGMQLHNGKFGDYRMNEDQYTDYIINLYKTLKDSVDTSDLNDFGKEYWNVKLQAQLASAATYAQRLLSSNYYNTYDNWGEKIPDDSVNINLSTENIKEIASFIDFNNTKLLMVDETDDLGYNTELWKNAGINPGIMETIAVYNNAYKAASNAQLDEAMLTELHKSYPALADEVAAHNEAQKTFLASIDTTLVSPTPDVAADKILNAIIAPYKGKVVMVDLWNTWCGPCRSAIARNEPVKSGKLSSDDIVWIYIADESSPISTYMSMIKDIRGKHYRLNEEQINILRKQYNVDGIPYYILVDRKGKATGRPDLRDHSLFTKTILDELAK